MSSAEPIRSFNLSGVNSCSLWHSSGGWLSQNRHSRMFWRESGEFSKWPPIKTFGVRSKLVFERLLHRPLTISSFMPGIFTHFRSETC